jgi:uncharacterized protein
MTTTETHYHNLNQVSAALDRFCLDAVNFHGDGFSRQGSLAFVSLLMQGIADVGEDALGLYITPRFELLKKIGAMEETRNADGTISYRRRHSVTQAQINAAWQAAGGEGAWCTSIMPMLKLGARPHLSPIDMADVIDPGAFSRTLNTGKSTPILWQHDPGNPIGSCKVTDTPQGLQVNGTLMLSDPRAQKAHTFMKAGIVKGLSIGYDTIQANFDGDVRHLTELRLWEISVVTFPMNEQATVTGVKSLSDADRAKHLKAIDHHQRQIASHVKAMLNPEDDDTLLDDPSIFDEGDDDDDDDNDDKAFLLELRKLVEQADKLTMA